MDNCILGGEEGRMGGWLAVDPSRRGRASPAVNIGSLSKQKAPMANDPPASKDAMVSYLMSQVHSFYPYTYWYSVCIHGSTCKILLVAKTYQKCLIFPMLPNSELV